MIEKPQAKNYFAQYLAHLRNEVGGSSLASSILKQVRGSEIEYLERFSNAPHFSIPENGRLLGDGLKGLGDLVGARLPYPRMTIEFEYRGNPKWRTKDDPSRYWYSPMVGTASGGAKVKFVLPGPVPTKWVVMVEECSFGDIPNISEMYDSKWVEECRDVPVILATSATFQYGTWISHFMRSVVARDEFRKTLIGGDFVEDCIRTLWFALSRDNGSGAPAYTTSFVPAGPAQLSMMQYILSDQSSCILLPSVQNEPLSPQLLAILGVLPVETIDSLMEVLEALSCSNVSHEVLQPAATAAVNAKRRREGKLELLETRHLIVEVPQETHIREGGGSGRTHASPRMHLRRGHIRKLPLREGEAAQRKTWVNSTIVGANASGVVEKTYELVKKKG